MRKWIAAALFLAPVAAHADEVKKLTGADLSVQTHKWEGKTVETTGYCFYADKDDYRCHAGTTIDGPRVDFTKIEPEAARKKLEDNCDTLAKMFTNKCLVHFQFVYEKFDEMEHPGRDATPIVIPKDGIATIVGK